jgi:hypothetical protein
MYGKSGSFYIAEARTILCVNHRQAHYEQSMPTRIFCARSLLPDIGGYAHTRQQRINGLSRLLVIDHPGFEGLALAVSRRAVRVFDQVGARRAPGIPAPGNDGDISLVGPWQQSGQKWRGGSPIRAFITGFADDYGVPGIQHGLRPRVALCESGIHVVGGSICSAEHRVGMPRQRQLLQRIGRSKLHPLAIILGITDA